MPNVNFSMQDDSSTSSGQLVPTAGGALQIQFEPGSAQVQVDYSKQDSIIVNVSGQVSLKALGVPIDVGAGATADLSGVKGFDGNIAIEINKDINAKLDFGHDQSGNSVTAGLTINFG
jgi:hypothetical protein